MYYNLVFVFHYFNIVKSQFNTTSRRCQTEIMITITYILYSFYDFKEIVLDKAKHQNN